MKLKYRNGIIFLLLVAILYYFSVEVFSKIDLTEFISNFGILAPLVFILVYMLQFFILIIPAQVIGIAGGYLFGVWFGTFLNLLGMLLGTAMIVLLVRRFGQPMVEKFVRKEYYDKFYSFSKEKGWVALFLVYLFPFFPDDSISYIAGLTKISLKKILVLAFIGRLPELFFLSLVGAGLIDANSITRIVLIGVVLFISAIIYFSRDFLQNKVYKMINGE